MQIIIETDKLLPEMKAKLREIVPELFPAEDEPLFFVPKKDEVYEWLNGEGEGIPSVWQRDSIDLKRLAIGNVFRVGGGEKAAAKRRAETACRQWASENGWFKPKDGEERWFVAKNGGGHLNVSDGLRWQYSPDAIQFRTQKEAERFLAECGEHLKVWWGMEDVK